jgi:hypothetical protein
MVGMKPTKINKNNAKRKETFQQKMLEQLGM